MSNTDQQPLTRDVRATQIPSGNIVELKAGTPVMITQALGGTFTVVAPTAGGLFRINGADADALGKEPPPALELPEGARDEDVEKLVWQQLRTCFDPEIPIDVVELGLVYTCTLERLDDGRRKVNVEMTLTAPGCGMGDILVDDVRTKLEMIPTIAEADVELVFDPPWNHSMMSEAAKLETGMF